MGLRVGGAAGGRLWPKAAPDPRPRSGARCHEGHGPAAGDEDGSLDLAVETGEYAEQGGLAAPLGTEQGDDLTGTNVEIEPVDHRPSVEAAGQSLDMDHGMARHDRRERCDGSGTLCDGWRVVLDGRLGGPSGGRGMIRRGGPRHLRRDRCPVGTGRHGSSLSSVRTTRPARTPGGESNEGVGAVPVRACGCSECRSYGALSALSESYPPCPAIPPCLPALGDDSMAPGRADRGGRTRYRRIRADLAAASGRPHRDVPMTPSDQDQTPEGRTLERTIMSGHAARRKKQEGGSGIPEASRPDFPRTVIGRNDRVKSASGIRGASAIPATRGGRHPQQVDVTTRGEQD